MVMFNWCVVSLCTCAVSVFGVFIYLCHLNTYLIHLVCKEHDALNSVYDYIIGKLCRDGNILFHSISFLSRSIVRIYLHSLYPL
jgi:hypothetical protein